MARGLDLLEHRRQVDPAVLGRERPEPPRRLLELALAADPVSTRRLVPRNSDVHEALEEVLLGRVRRPPGKLQLLVRGEELAAADQVDACFKRRL